MAKNKKRKLILAGAGTDTGIWHSQTSLEQKQDGPVILKENFIVSYGVIHVISV
jgi:hypothetical protein